MPPEFWAKHADFLLLPAKYQNWGIRPRIRQIAVSDIQSGPKHAITRMKAG
jgi:hypothetical protein